MLLLQETKKVRRKSGRDSRAPLPRLTLIASLGSSLRPMSSANEDHTLYTETSFAQHLKQRKIRLRPARRSLPVVHPASQSDANLGPQ